MPNGTEVFQIRERLLQQRLERLNRYITEDTEAIESGVSSQFARRGIRAGSRAIGAEQQRATREGLRGLRESVSTAQGQLDLLRAQELQRVENQAALDAARAEALAQARGARTQTQQESFLAQQRQLQPLGAIEAIRPTTGVGGPTQYVVRTFTGVAGSRTQRFGSLNELNAYLRRNPALQGRLVSQGLDIAGGSGQTSLNQQEVASLSPYISVISRAQAREQESRSSVIAGLKTVQRTGVRKGTRPQDLTPRERAVEKQNIEARMFDAGFKDISAFYYSKNETVRDMARDLVGAYLRGRGMSTLQRHIQKERYTPTIPSELLNRYKELI